MFWLLENNTNVKLFFYKAPEKVVPTFARRSFPDHRSFNEGGSVCGLCIYKGMIQLRLN